MPAVAPARHEPDEKRWQLLLGRALAHAEYRDLPTAHADLDEVLDDTPPDSRFRARALTQLADVQPMEGDYPASFATIDTALELWRELGDEHGLATALRARGRASMFSGDMARGDADCNEALAVYRRIGDRRGEAWALQNLATIAFFRGDTVVAEERLNAAETMFEELGDWGGSSWTRALLAWIRFMEGKLDLAESLALEQLPESDARGDRYVAGLLEMLLGNVALWRGQVTSARRAFAAARCRAFGRWATPGPSARPWASSCAHSPRPERSRRRITRLESETAMGQAGLPLHILRAQILVHVGDPDALPAALHLRGGGGSLRVRAWPATRPARSRSRCSRPAAPTRRSRSW